MVYRREEWAKVRKFFSRGGITPTRAAKKKFLIIERDHVDDTCYSFPWQPFRARGFLAMVA